VSEGVAVAYVGRKRRRNARTCMKQIFLFTD